MSQEFWDYMNVYGTKRATLPPARPPAPRSPGRPAGRRGRKYTPQQARLRLATCAGMGVFIALVCCLHSSPAPSPSSGGSTSGPMQYGPHNPGMAAAVIGGEARGVGHAAGFAGRMAARGVIMRGLGRGFGGGGFGGFSGGTDTGGGISFGGFGF